MSKNNIRLLLLVFASVLLLASCQRTLEPNGEQGLVEFAVGIEDGTVLKNGTKAAMLGSTSTLGSIFVSGWNNDSGHAQFIEPYQEYEVTSGVAATEVRWAKPLAKQFYAYANLPESGASVENADYTGQTLTYTVPADAAQQKDILLASTASDGSTCSETTRSATLNFKHPLTALEFKVGEIIGLTKITKISIDGIYASGSVTQNADGSFAAWSASGSQTVYQTISGDLPAKGSAVGVPFILIPQSAAKFSVAIEGVNNIGEDTLLGGEIAASGGNNWEAGKKNVVTIDYTLSKSLNFSTEVTAWVDKTAEEMDMEKTIGPTPTPDPRGNTLLVDVDGFFWMGYIPITLENMNEAVQLSGSDRKPDTISGYDCIDIIQISISEDADVSYIYLYNPSFIPSDLVYFRKHFEDGTYLDSNALVNDNQTIRLEVTESCIVGIYLRSK